MAENVLLPESVAEEVVEGPLPDYRAAGGVNGELRSSFQQMQGPVTTKHWLYATTILCCYGFFKEFKPSEPFLTPYLVDVKNFTKDEVWYLYVNECYAPIHQFTSMYIPSLTT